MKHIEKTDPPESFSNWCQTQKDLGQNYNYNSLQNPEKNDFHNHLLIEQGSICGYTMKRISKNVSHLEHIKPKHICIQEGEGLDLDPRNLIACFPREGMPARCRYGAQFKDKWWVEKGKYFISPINPDCETFFLFSINGEIRPADPLNKYAKTTIGVLKLDDPQLCNDRRNAIESFIFGSDGQDPIDVNLANTAIGIICNRSADGIFYEYCVAIRDALREYLQIFQNIN